MQIKTISTHSNFWPRALFTTLYFLHNYKLAQKARVFIYGRSFRLSIMFAGEARSLS